MTRMKKLASILLALVMVMAVATASAANVTVTNGTDGHTYMAYQIFTGSQGESEGALGNVEWANGVNGDALVTELATHEAFTGCVTAADVANKLAGKPDKCPEALLLAEIAQKHLNVGAPIAAGETTLPAGYYLLVDTTVVDDKTDDAANPALLQITNDITIEQKYTVPEVGKTVKDKDYSLGEEITYTLTATMPENLADYETYKIVFHDTMDAGIVYVPGSVVVEIGKMVEGQFVKDADVTTQFTVPTEVTSKLTITCLDVLAAEVAATKDSVFKVTYKAILTEEAAIAHANKNTVHLEFSNNPNVGGEGSTGQTPPEYADVYTWEIPVFKFTGTDTPLAGAGFTLYKAEDTNKENPIVVTKASVQNWYYVCSNPTGNHDVEPLKSTEHDVAAHITEMTSDAEGKLVIKGLDSGSYVLVETTTPDGYNTCADVKVVIDKDGKLTQDGTPTTEVGILNQSGATLPETGGIGTTILYVAGGLLIAAALVVLLAKRRTAA